MSRDRLNVSSYANTQRLNPGSVEVRTTLRNGTVVTDRKAVGSGTDFPTTKSLDVLSIPIRTNPNVKSVEIDD